MSNSKLTKEQKAWLKGIKAENPKLVFGASADGVVTVALVREGERSGAFSVSVAGVDEEKIRRKVGEFHATQRMIFDGGQPIPLATPENRGCPDDADYLREVAGTLASAINDASSFY